MIKNRSIKELEELTDKNRILLKDCAINSKLYYFGYKCTVINSKYLKYNDFNCITNYAYKHCITVTNNELDNWIQSYYIRGLKLTKEQIINNIDKLDLKEAKLILTIDESLTEKDLGILINKSIRNLNILIKEKLLSTKFWQSNLNQVIIQEQLPELIQYQKLNDKFIKTNLKFFNKEIIKDILTYQEENISAELKNELNILYKIMK